MVNKQGLLFWLANGLLALAFIQHGISAFVSEHYLEEMKEFGFPEYFVPAHGIAKIFGGIFLLIPKKTFLKHWAYSGMFFNLIFASIAEYQIGEFPFFQLLLVFLLMLAYYAYLKFAPFRA